ncbi:putative PEP-CTERM system histidine kinase [Desulfuromusa kysingii]|uniref:histidine kinase n=1 Tax=Desulfuromusa kysingii TaxID=37625 RepID=A0A1H4BBI0_9BACT|nr:XrtA/PEP-CTERM system histidine kinase PrsK [Desulfuromusa kysingii]SEA45491.1 putative PEP-CTERM system histidine kinase [Desulfuromusa kysingii]
MLTEALLWSNIIICPLVGGILLLRRPYQVATLLLVAALFFFSGLAFIDLRSLQQPEQIFFWRKYGLFFEVIAILCCYFHTKTAFRDNSEIYKGKGFWISVVLALALLFAVIVNPIENLLFSPDFAEEQIFFLTKQGFVVYLLLMIYLVFGLVQLERTLSGLHQTQRWGVKLIVLSSGLLLVSFALYFSQSLLYRSINMNYLAIRSLAVFCACLLFGYSYFYRDSGSKLALSRGIAHRSFVLLIVGGYLILLGIVGEGLRYLNLTHTKQIFSGLLLLSILGLAIVFLSEKLRRKLKVILHKNFYQSKYDYQEQWKKFADRMTSGLTLSDIQSSILELFCDSLACKGAALYLYDYETKTYVYASAFNSRRDWRPFAETDPLVVNLQQKEWIINLREEHPELVNSLVESFDDIGAFLVVPLFFDEGLAGFIVLGEQIDADEILTYEDYDLLRMLARQAIATVQGLRLSEQLTISRELAAIGKVSTFVLHDLKNQVSGLSLMLDNAKDYIDNPEFQQDMLETVGNTVKNMKGLIGRLKNIKEKPALVIASVSLDKIIGEAAETAGSNIDIDGSSVRVAVDEEEIYKVILNLFVNAIEATKSKDDFVRVKYGEKEKQAFVEISDCGCGMSADFVETRLFKPFETTKKHGFGIGLYQCKQIVESHGGTIEVHSLEGEGTTFTLLLPLAASQN